MTYSYIALGIRFSDKFWWFFCSSFLISLLGLVTPAFGRSDLSGHYSSSNGKYFEIRRSHGKWQKFFRHGAAVLCFVTSANTLFCHALALRRCQSVLPETFCQKKRSYSKITEKRTFYPKITEKRTFWPKKTEKERNSGAQKNGVRSLERVLATLSMF